MNCPPPALPPLPYSYDALEPYIDRRTLELHHQKHMAAYVQNLAKALEGCPKCNCCTLEQLILRAPRFPRATATALINNAGGVYNHQFYFESMSAIHDQAPFGSLLERLERQYESVDKFWAVFKKQALAVFGSGWLWLCYSRRCGFELVGTQNQLTTLGTGLIPILCIDVWEHAYYLQYQNRRGDYIDAWRHVVNWQKALERFCGMLTPHG